MAKSLRYVINLGVSSDATEQSNQRVKFTNTIALLYLVFMSLMVILLVYQYEFDSAAKLVLYSIIIPVLTLSFNFFGKTIISRYWLSYTLPFYIMLISVYTKLDNEVGVTAFYEFFDTRMLVFVSALIPLLIFSRKHFHLLLIALLPSCGLLFGYDAIHTLFNVGYTNLFDDPEGGYYIAGLMFDVSYVFATMGILALKKANEVLVANNAILIKDLNNKNSNQEKILLRKQELLAQNIKVQDALLKKHKELILNKTELESASELINSQKNELEYKNQELSSLVDEKTRELKQANVELVAQNNGLLQFSNTVSHNLRAPVASLLGLVHLFTIETEADRKEEMISHIKSSSVALDTIISDLNKVVDLRNQVFSLKERVSLKDEIDQVLILLRDKLEQSGVELTSELEVEHIYSVRVNMQSILYNLISNGIKYANTEVKGKVIIRSRIVKNDLIVSIEDNGIGIDLNQFGNDLFKLYKRFHVHLEGKGMGLYIVKEQVEAMEGTISVESSVMEGTTFTLKFPYHSSIEKQEYFRSEDASITYDAVCKTSILKWFKTPTTENYRTILNFNKEMLAKYNTRTWFIDIKKLGIIGEEDRNWFATKVLSEILKRGCKHIVLVRNEEDGKDYAYWEEMIKTTRALNVKFKFYYDFDLALEYIKNENLKGSFHD